MAQPMKKSTLSDFKIPEVRRGRRYWYVEVLQYNGKWEFIAAGPSSRTFGGVVRQDWRDVLADINEAERFYRKMDAERFAFMIATTNPERVGKIRVTRY